MQELGKAELGDKTMIDALLPFADELERGVKDGLPLARAWTSAAEVASEAAARTADLRPRLGRARPLAEKSVGTPDPGAVSMGLIVTAIGKVLDDATAEPSSTNTTEE